ncbi:protein translocase subunit SecD [uncultured Tyzzerella sp.]|uniref:protein translocase subunit SecD n=1 Tax=uncultured Tyzzerella sp. TaxID=2321398 RepID=UPI002941FFF2|nr:protein translocase subunit SecD [uncultured Tyzzerella sp.]
MKTKNKNVLLLFIIFIITGVLFYTSYNGYGNGHILSYKNIEKGLDLSGGVYIVYEAQEEIESNNKEISSEYDTTVEDESKEVSSEESSQNESEEESDKKEDVESLGEASWKEKMESAISMIQQRLDRKGWTEANVYQEGDKRIRVEIPGIDDVETAVSEIGQTAKLSFVDINGQVVVKGEDVINAKKQAYTDQGGQSKIVVSLEFNEKGKEDFKIATEANIGKPILIMLDDEIISAPTVNAVIPDGKAIIEGNFDIESAEELASLIRAGSLPFELEILEMNTIGATLGANALKTSITGGAVGIALVLVFMILFYRAKGFAASLALVIYILLELIFLNGLNITLTLHGIAGIILSVGMAVDANVIIFERIREEILQGRTLKLAIDKGFSRAFPAILDSNITTLIAGAVLYWLGSGPIKGFAQTLMLGIVLSMFTALVVTKIIVKAMVNAGIKSPKLYGGK